MNHSPSNSKKRGAALVAVIWLVAILAMATVVTLRVVSLDVDLGASQIHGFRARQLAEMGIAVASNPAVKRTDPLLKQFSGESGEGFEARIISEGEKFNINAILLKQDEQFLKSLFSEWGLTLDE